MTLLNTAQYSGPAFNVSTTICLQKAKLYFILD